MSSPAYAFTGAKDWGDPYIVSVIISGLAYLSWQHQERIEIRTGDSDSGVDAQARMTADLCNEDQVPVQLNLRVSGDNIAILEGDDVKVVFSFSEDLSEDSQALDLMARALLGGKAVYQIKKLTP